MEINNFLVEILDENIDFSIVRLWAKNSVKPRVLIFKNWDNKWMLSKPISILIICCTEILKKLLCFCTVSKDYKNKKHKEKKWDHLRSMWGFSGGTSGKDPACQCRRHKRHEFDPWIRKIPWRWARQPIPVFAPGESHGQSPGGLQSVGSQRVGMVEVT